jgi:hypothetical protein
VLLTEPDSIRARWVDHFSGLLNVPSEVDMSVLDRLEQRPVVHALDAPISMAEVVKACQQQKNSKAPGGDGIPADVWKYGPEELQGQLLLVLNQAWREGAVPQAWKDARICSLYKKGDRADPGNYRGIALLVTAGKILTRVIVNRLVECFDYLVPESQCGFRRGRSTVDMMFSVRQLQEKCREQRQPLFSCFVDLTKAYDTVHRGLLWQVLAKFGVPPSMLSVIKDLHEGMKAVLLMGDGESDPIAVKNGLRQGCVLAPNTFLLFMAAMLMHAFGDIREDLTLDGAIYIKFGGQDRLFDPRQLRDKYQLALLLDMLFADDMGIFAHSEACLQRFMTRLADACKGYGLTISCGKTVVMLQQVPGAEPLPQPSITVHGTTLNNVSQFVYLGGIVTDDASVDAEVTVRLRKAWVVFGRLYKRVWGQSHIRVKTKLSIFRCTVLATLLYGVETMALKQTHLKRMDALVHRCLRSILRVKWYRGMTNEEVRKRADTLPIEVVIRRRRLGWLGHLARMEENRIPRRIMFGELLRNNRPAGGPKQRWKDAVAGDLDKFGIGLRDPRASARSVVEVWPALAKKDKGSAWRAKLDAGMIQFHEEYIAGERRRRARRHERAQRPSSVPPLAPSIPVRILRRGEPPLSVAAEVSMPPLQPVSHPTSMPQPFPPPRARTSRRVQPAPMSLLGPAPPAPTTAVATSTPPCTQPALRPPCLTPPMPILQSDRAVVGFYRVQPPPYRLRSRSIALDPFAASSPQTPPIVDSQLSLPAIARLPRQQLQHSGPTLPSSGRARASHGPVVEIASPPPLSAQSSRRSTLKPPVPKCNAAKRPFSPARSKPIVEIAPRRQRLKLVPSIPKAASRSEESPIAARLRSRDP